MPEEPISFYYERRLQQEIEGIVARIHDLNLEKAALERQLIKARRENAGVHDVSRKNSINRVMIERRILDALAKAKRALSSRELFREAQQVTFQLNESTFRTHLHRLKKKGAVVNGDRPGMWLTPPDSSAFD